MGLELQLTDSLVPYAIANMQLASSTKLSKLVQPFSYTYFKWRSEQTQYLIPTGFDEKSPTVDLLNNFVGWAITCQDHLIKSQKNHMATFCYRFNNLFQHHLINYTQRRQIPPKAMMHFPPVSDSPLLANIFRLHQKFSQFTLFRQKFLFLSAKICPPTFNNF